MSKYLITGGCGFIGSHVAHLLVKNGQGVRVLDNLSTGHRENLPRGVELIVGDVADRRVLERAMAGVDGCVHLAAVASVERCSSDWLGTHRTNLTGTLTVFDCARPAHGHPAIPVVYASSAAVYGDPYELPLSELTPTRPLSSYGADKLSCELHARVATLQCGVPAVGLRFFNVYGPRQDPQSPYSGVISIFGDRLSRGRPLTLFGDGLQLRDFIYVSDVARAVWTALQAKLPAGGVFNICTGTPTSIAMLAHMMSVVLRAPLVIQHAPPRASDIRVSVGDTRHAAEHLGFRSTVALLDGLAETMQVEWPAALGVDPATAALQYSVPDRSV